MIHVNTIPQVSFALLKNSLWWLLLPLFKVQLLFKENKTSISIDCETWSNINNIYTLLGSGQSITLNSQLLNTKSPQIANFLKIKCPPNIYVYKCVCIYMCIYVYICPCVIYISYCLIIAYYIVSIIVTW